MDTASPIIFLQPADLTEGQGQMEESLIWKINGCYSSYPAYFGCSMGWTTFLSEVKWSCSVMSNSFWPHGLQPTRLLHPWDFPGKNTGVGCHCLLQGIFLTQRLNPGLPHCRQMPYPLKHQRRHLPNLSSNCLHVIEHRAGLLVWPFSSQVKGGKSFPYLSLINSCSLCPHFLSLDESISS